MTHLDGTRKITGTVAYVPQSAWILNHTVRGNILYGVDYDRNKYDKVSFFRTHFFSRKFELWLSNFNLRYYEPVNSRKTFSLYQDVTLPSLGRMWDIQMVFRWCVRRTQQGLKKSTLSPVFSRRFSNQTFWWNKKKLVLRRYDVWPVRVRAIHDSFIIHFL